MTSKPHFHGDSPQHRRNVIVVDDVIHPGGVSQELISSQQASDVSGRYSDPLPRSMVASFASTESLLGSKENLSQFLSVEDRLLDELKSEIFACNARNSELNEKLKQIRPLQRHVEELEISQTKLTNEVAFKDDLVESLKQRVSVLHEQNNQLARVVENSRSSGADVLSTRNALVASLAQLKTLQDQVNTIPQLKSEIKLLSSESAKYRNITSDLNLPEGSNCPSYDTLCIENSALKSKNEALVKDTEVLRADLLIVSNSAEGLKNRLDMFEKSMVSVSTLEDRIQKLEGEKSLLYQRAIELKSDNHDRDSELISKSASSKIAELEKVNNSLQRKLEQMQAETRMKKGKLALKLLQMEALSVKTHTSEIEKQVLDMDRDARSTMRSTSPDHADLDPTFEVQLLKLQQIQSLRQQSHSVLKVLHSDKQEADKKLLELQSQLSQDSVLAVQQSEHGSKFHVAQIKLTVSEQTLDDIDYGSDADLLQGPEMRSSPCSMGSDNQTGTDRDYHSLLQDYESLKKDKRKARKKLKVCREKLHVLATELTDSVELVSKFQSQCMILQEELNLMRQSDASASSVQVHTEGKPVQYIKVISSDTAEKEQIIFETKERQKLSEQVAELEDKLEKSRYATSAAESESELLKNNSDALQRQLQQSEEALFIQNSANESLKAEISMYTSEKMPFLTSEIERLTVYCNKIQAQLDTVEQQNKMLQTSISQKENQVHEHDAALKLFEERTTANESLQKDMACEIQKLKEQNDRLIHESKHLQVLCDQQQVELLSKTELNKQTQEEVLLLTAKLDSQVEMNESLEHQCHDYQLNAERNAASAERQMCALKDKHQQLCMQHDQVINELESVKLRSQAHADELLGCQATIHSLRRQLDIAETREVEHEELKLRIRRLECTINASSQLKHDNKALLGMLQDTINEMPSLTNETGSELRQENHRLEEQVSVLSQWNDKQRMQIEELESQLETLEGQKYQLLIDLTSKENSAQENAQLKRELEEVETEVNTLRQQVRADLNEETKIKLATQSRLLSMFSEHNASLQKQVQELHAQVRGLGGALERDKPVSPPPMMDGALIVATEEKRIADLERANDSLKHQLSYLESEIKRLQDISLTVKRRSGSFCATSSVPLAIFEQDFQESVPPEMLLPCSLMADHLNTRSVDDAPTKAWLDSIRKEWFRCVSQKAVSKSCVECYITSISALSLKLLQTVVNFQDEKGNSALHHAIRNENLPVVKLLTQISCCDINITNHAGYTPLMMLCATSYTDMDDRVLHTLIKKGNINYRTEQDLCTPLMLAAAAGQSNIVSTLLDAGATVNAQDKDGSTALMFAVQNGHTDTLKRLLTAPNCDVHLRDSDGLTVQDISNAAGYTEASVLIKEHLQKSL